MLVDRPGTFLASIITTPRNTSHNCFHGFHREVSAGPVYPIAWSNQASNVSESAM
ncbi:uncharacterized protein METZ01_LOCUS124449 [marine metagenome]|uniref:Uncharacterized protein n=1 Tax=marine metagenome TaxID=408172 RepID=A0A381Y3S6_9ZZZZ